MKEIKFYCDICGKEVKSNEPINYIDVDAIAGKHGHMRRTIRIIDVADNKSLDFCDDCKTTLKILFGGNHD